MYALFNVDKPTGANPGAGGGLKTVVYAALLSDIATFGARGEDLVTIATNFVMEAGKFIHQIYATDKTIEPKETKLAGENKDCGGVEISLNFFHPGLIAKIQEFKAKHMNEDFILFIRDFTNDVIYVIGEPGNPAWMEGFETTWGKTIAEGKGTSFTFKSQQSLPMAIYTGEFDTLVDDGTP